MPDEQKIEFIPNDEFTAASEEDFAQIDVALYAEEEDLPRSRGRRELVESFLWTVEQSRLLTFEGEQFLFKRLNFLRFRAHSLQQASKTQRRRRTQEEIDRLLAEANATRDEIACANLRLVKSIARRLSNSPDEFDEYLAEANPILLNAIDKFDYARGYRFSTYATHAVQRHIFRLIERRNRLRKRETLDASAALDAAADSEESNEPSEKDVLSAFELVMSRIDDALNEREQFIVRRRFGLDDAGKGMSLRAIGDELGISKERTRQLFQRAMEKLAEVAKPFESVFVPP